MDSVNRLLAAVLLLLTACTSTSTVTSSPPLPTTPTTPIVTTTAPGLELQMRNCVSPPVTFSPLCEIYELLDTWYVDAPVEAEVLADVAVRGLRDFTTSATEEPPRTLFCAIPDPAFASLCEELALQVEENRVPVGAAVEAAMMYMIDVGLDPFTYYLPPDQAGALRLNGIVGGIGVLLDARDAAGSKCTEVRAPCRLEIVVVLDENAGAEAGLEVGDVIVAVDSQPVEGRGFTSIVSEIAGDESGEILLSVERDGTPLEFTIRRRELTIPTVEYGVPFDDVGYLRIPDFELDVPQLVAESLSEIGSNELALLVVDLRDNPGGFVDSVVEVADEFVDGGIVMASESPDEYLEYPADPGGVATEPDLLVLVNRGTASAAEILATTLQDRRQAVVIGSHTFGKDAVQIPFTLRNGGEFYVAVARWSSPDGTTVANGGLQPDRAVTWPDGATVHEVVEIALEAAQ
jgi:carboxyl-terminal processing protease